MSYNQKIFLSWKRTPLIFDSRGKFFSPPKKESRNKNELIGETVSYGKIKGKAKVLRNVNEKDFFPGEILVTYATDPGWTPLIINSGGVVLEVGGMLQHGALVSREFNKPCVVGIDNVMNKIKDGNLIEVDAIEGVVRILDNDN
jgi:pyruvate,water dikinase